MREEELMLIRNNLCNHLQHRNYNQKRLDILNGFQLTLIRCINCHKVLSLEAKKIREYKTQTNSDISQFSRFLISIKILIDSTKKMINKFRIQIKEHVWIKALFKLKLIIDFLWYNKARLKLLFSLKKLI